MEKRDKQEGTTKQTGRKDRNNIQLKISNQSLKENPETMWPVKPDTFFYSAIFCHTNSYAVFTQFDPVLFFIF